MAVFIDSWTYYLFYQQNVTILPTMYGFALQYLYMNMKGHSKNLSYRIYYTIHIKN